MKRKLFISFIISFITVLGLNVSAQADTTITRVTLNSYEDSMPQIKGNYVVWQGHVNGHWQVFLYNILYNTEEGTTQITNYNYDSISPRTDGEYVVWSGKGTGSTSSIYSEILLYNIESGEISPITDDNNTCIDSSPQIADGRVVWTSHEVTTSVEPGEINLYDIVTGQKLQLTDNDLDDVSPRINSEYVVWLQIDEDDNSTLFRYLLPGGPAQSAPEGFIWDSPQTDGDLTVSMINDSNDWEIIVRKDGENGFEQITDNSMNDRYPSISGNNIAWMAGEGQASEIYIAQYTAADECECDLNSDGRCDMEDWLLFGEDWGRTDCTLSDPCECDLNDDGRCDMEDWLLFGEDWGRTDCPAVP